MSIPTALNNQIRQFEMVIPSEYEDGINMCCIQVGNEFSSVEALWSSFENVMAKETDADADTNTGEVGREDDENDESELPTHRSR